MTDFCLSLKSHLNVTFPTIITKVGHSLLLFFFSLAHLSHSVIIQLLCDYLINGCISAKCWIQLGPRPSYIFVSRSSLSQRFVLGTWHSAWYSNVGIKYHWMRECELLSYFKHYKSFCCCSVSQLWLFATRWTAARQAPLSLGISWSSDSWWYHPAISFSAVPFSSCLQSSPASGSFLMNRLVACSSHQVAKVLECQLHHQSF